MAEMKPNKKNYKLNVSCFNCSATTRLHCFQNNELRQKWLDVIPNIKEENIDNNFRLCSAHFDDKYLTKTDTLKWRAIPSKFYVNGSWATITEIPTSMIENSTTLIPISTVQDSNPINSSLMQPAETDDLEMKTDADLDAVSYQIVVDKELIITQSREFSSVRDIQKHVLYSPKTSRRALILCKTEIQDQRRHLLKLRRQLSGLKTTLSETEKFLDCLEADGIIKNRPRLGD